MQARKVNEPTTERKQRSPRYRRVESEPFQITERDLDFLEVPGRHGVVQSTHFDLLFPTSSTQHLRRRLKHLFHAGYLARPELRSADHNGSLAMLYLLTESGANLLAHRRGIRFTPKSDDLKLSQLSHTLDITGFMVAIEAACQRSIALALEPFPDILSRSPAATRVASTPEKWEVNIKHRGTSYTFHLRPDAIFDVCHRKGAEKGDPRARKYFFLERDRGTMPIERADLYQTSILRKYLCYAETHRAGIHRDRFGMNNMRVLFVGKSKSRIDAMIRAFHDHMTALASPRLFLFADEQSLFANGAAFFDYRWLDGEGKEHTLFE